MSRYVRKHKRHFFGIAFPALMLLIVGVIGIQVFPGWIQPSYGVVGANCATSASTENDPLISACDLCAGERCVFNTMNSTNQCTLTAPPFDCSTFQLPSCFQCFTTVEEETSTFFFPSTQCLPDDQFCQDITGGTLSNDCRIGECVNTSITIDNPSGCNYEFDSADTLCINCEPPLPTGVTNCGNGVCEIDNGEDPSTCSLDCRVPGFTGTVPANQTTLNAACPGVPTITFPGPPFNTPGSNFCEDGDICTTNECNANGTCDTTQNTCDDTNSDLCCPAGCTEATDVDCLPPEECTIPTPTPTPTPTPPSDIVQGSGQVFNCSFLSGSAVSTLSGLKYLVLMMVGLSSLIFFRSRAKN